MASFVPYRDKNGNIVSYQIQVYRGRDAEGKKLKPYVMSWEVPEGWKQSSIDRELKRVAAEFEAECKQGLVSTNKQTFAQYSEYVMQLKERDNKHRTVFRYRELLERINAEIGPIRMSDITAENLNSLYLKLGQPGAKKRIKKGAKKGTVETTDKGLSPRTILHHHRLIRHIFAQAVKEGIVRYNVADAATPPKVPKKEAEFFELEEVLAIRDALKNQPLKWQAITNLFIDTGARRGEILGLKWNCIDFKNNQIKIENNLQYTKDRGIFEDTTKTDESRTINVAPEIMNILQAHKKEQLQHKLKVGSYWTDTNYCFTQDNGLPMNPDSINKWLRNFSKQNNLPAIHPHKFRHTQASLLYATGENPVTISKRLGHKQVSTTQNIYAHLLENGDKQASDKIANLLYRNLDKSIK